MNKFKDWLQRFSNKVGKSRVLTILQGAFVMLMPLMIIGSFFSLFAGFPIEAYQSFINDIGLAKVFQLVYTYTYDYFALYLSFAVAYQYAIKTGLRKHALSVGIFGIVCFLMTCPMEEINKWIGTPGMFMALCVGYFTGFIYKICIQHNLTIRLPDSVPTGVSKAFTSMVPGFLLCIIFVIVHYGFTLTSYGSAQNALYALIRVPLGLAKDNIFGEIILVTFARICWFFGIHGGTVINPIQNMIFTQNKAENMAAFQAGLDPSNMFCGPNTVIQMAFIGYIIAILLFSKNKGVRGVAKVATVPAIFGIQEPFAFGVPFILNPIFFIPYCFLNVFYVIFTHLCQVIGFLPYCRGLQLVNQVPGIIRNTMNYGWQGAAVYIIVTIIGILIWAPFIKMNDRQLEKDIADNEVKNV